MTIIGRIGNSQVAIVDSSIKSKFKVTANSNDTSVTIKNQSTKKGCIFLMDFGDGTIIKDTQMLDYFHKYMVLGKYYICLTVTDTTGLTSISTISCDSVEFTQKGADCAVDFTYIIKGLTVTVKNISAGTFKKVVWDFGDGNKVKDEDSLTHTYLNPGAYDIDLFVKKKNVNCESETIKNVIALGNNVSCIAYYTYLIDSGKKVQFSNQSVGGNLIYQWDFGDGLISNENNPVHKFTNPGIYKVQLFAEDKSFKLKSKYTSEITIENDSIDILPKFDALTDPVNDTVEFKNNSIGTDIQSYVWNFGDGIISSETAPIHVYQTAGEYSVCLSVIPKSGNKYNSICKSITVGQSQSYLPDFSFMTLGNDSVSFISNFNYKPDSVLWNFGDGNVSFDSQPFHVFSKESKYLVSLKSKYNHKIFEKIGIINTSSNQAKLQCMFKYDTTEEVSHLKAAAKAKVKFKGSLSGDISRKLMIWNFGDGTYDSTNLEIEHVYVNDGKYIVCMNVENYLTGDNDNFCDTIQIGTISSVKSTEAPVALFSVSPNPTSGKLSLNIYAGSSQKTNVALYDLSGRLISTLFAGNMNKGINKLSFHLEIQKGIYLLNVQSTAGKNSVKLFVE